MKRILILSGAGLSAESGIQTFRDEDGLWENHDVLQVCSTQGWIKDRKLVTKFYNQRRAELASKKPNLAHKTFAELEQKYRGRIMHFTQNVDDLLERAGCKDIIHLHGTLTDLRCEACTQTFYIGYDAQTGEESCPHCGNKRVRHNVVMFGETAPNYAELQQAMRHCSLFVAIGTSGTVIDIPNIARSFKHSVLIDPKRQPTKSKFDPHAFIDDYFEYFIHKKAVASMPELTDIIDKHL